jgi:hypothetical protein
MFSSLSGLWKAYRGRKAAVTMILPLVQGSRVRCRGIADGTWLDPYMIGFLTMLITLSARHKVSRLDSLNLGLVQQEAWADITGMRPEVLGEHALNLSVSGNDTFALGCHNAIAFNAALRQAGAAGFDSREVATSSLDAKDGEILQDLKIDALWAEYFEDHVQCDLRL